MVYVHNWLNHIVGTHHQNMWWLPSGNLTVCYWTYPIYNWFTYSKFKMVNFFSKLLVYQRVITTMSKCLHSIPDLDQGWWREQLQNIPIFSVGTRTETTQLVRHRAFLSLDWSGWYLAIILRDDLTTFTLICLSSFVPEDFLVPLNESIENPTIIMYLIKIAIAVYLDPPSPPAE